MRDASYFRKIKTDVIADNEDASGESDGGTENENVDTGALTGPQRPRRTTRMPSYLKDYDI